MFGRNQNMLLPQPAGGLKPVNLNETAEAKDKLFDSQEAAYNRDKKGLRVLLPDEKVRVQCEKTGLWDKIGTVLEVRPDKLSYLIDIEGKLLICARFMIRPLEGVVSDLQNQVKDQGGAQSAEVFVPRRSEHLKNQKTDLPCALPTTKLPNCGNIAALTGSTGSRWRRRCVSSQRPTISARMPGDFHWSMFSGPALQQEPQPSLWSPSLPWRSSFAAGSGQRGNAAPSIAIPSSCQLSPPPSSQAPRLPGLSS